MQYIPVSSGSEIVKGTKQASSNLLIILLGIMAAVLLSKIKKKK